MTSSTKGFGQRFDSFSTVSSPTGFDNGHGNPKVVIDGEAVIYPAYICADFVTDSSDFFPGLIELNGRKYLTGESAQFVPGMVRTADDEARKAEYALPMLLGGIARMQHRPQWNLKVVASAQSSEIRAQLPDRLNGQHEAILNNSDRTLINIQVLTTVPEGATISAFFPGTVALIDIGCGDLQGLVVQQYKVLRSTRYRGLDWVPMHIYSALKAQGKGLDLAAIRGAIDNGSLKTAGLTPIDFSDRYHAAMETWFASQLEPVLREIKSLSGIQKVIAIGGGVCNRQVRDYLQRYAITIPESPELLSAKALYQIAKAKLSN